MFKTISLTIPNDDAIAMREFGRALDRMAVAHGAPVAEPKPLAMKVEVDANKAVEAVREATVQPDTADDYQLDTTAPTATVDAAGLPWDARIHSGNREFNADGTWRARRKPKDMDATQWSDYVAQVRDELVALMAIPVVDGSPVDAFAQYNETVPAEPEPLPVPPIVTVDDSALPVPPVATVEPAPLPVPPTTVADPEPLPVPPVTDPVPPVTGAVPSSMAELMTWLTKHAPSGKEGIDRINGIVARHGLVALGQLTKRADLIPQIYADMVKEFGE